MPDTPIEISPDSTVTVTCLECGDRYHFMSPLSPQDTAWAIFEQMNRDHEGRDTPYPYPFLSRLHAEVLRRAACPCCTTGVGV